MMRNQLKQLLTTLPMMKEKEMSTMKSLTAPSVREQLMKEAIEKLRIGELRDALTLVVRMETASVREGVEIYSNVLKMTSDRRRQELSTALKLLLAKLSRVAEELVEDCR